MAVSDESELNLLYELITSLFYPALVDLLLLQGSLDIVDDVRDGALIGIIQQLVLVPELVELGVLVVSYKALEVKDLLASGIEAEIEVLDPVRRTGERFSAFFEDNGVSYNVVEAARVAENQSRTKLVLRLG